MNLSTTSATTTTIGSSSSFVHIPFAFILFKFTWRVGSVWLPQIFGFCRLALAMFSAISAWPAAMRGRRFHQLDCVTITAIANSYVSSEYHPCSRVFHIQNLLSRHRTIPGTLGALPTCRVKSLFAPMAGVQNQVRTVSVFVTRAVPVGHDVSARQNCPMKWNWLVLKNKKTNRHAGMDNCEKAWGLETKLTTCIWAQEEVRTTWQERRVEVLE